ncbi:MAG: hypothetical protein CML16_03135 [Pusillimonas sp.]|nr:hypothetical protein [Pusillimonas sp.]MBC43581.1 hypothetical protein [Pusillimonas sp.]HCP78964.1 hypothetical protein [Pusillimonas sp.]|tara:strand:- start:373 stop:591 length:219 start_codon:yes stop_codon:yes gene_type:complete
MVKKSESRTNGSIYGKCTERCDVTVAEDTNERLITLARMAGMTKAEYVRLLIERHIYGAGSQIAQRDPLLGT